MNIGTERPYPPTGLTTATWTTVGIDTVPLAWLTTTQDGVTIEGLLDRRRVSADPFPHVVVWRGVHYLEDGHCRMLRAALSGLADIEARVLYLD